MSAITIGPAGNLSAAAQTVSPEQLERATHDSSSWLSYGRDLPGQRYVELNQITPSNGNRLRPGVRRRKADYFPVKGGGSGLGS